MIVAGIGCKKGVEVLVIEHALRQALQASGLSPDVIDAFATHATKRDEAGLCELARRWSRDLLAFETDEMPSNSNQYESHSARVVALKGVPSVAEGAALAGAGAGARLLGPRFVTPEVACAFAEGPGRALCQHNEELGRQ